MPDETVAVLQEIAGLLRRRVEQQDEMTERAKELSSRSAERMAKMDEKQEKILGEDHEKQMAEITAKMERRGEEQRQEKKQQAAESQQFRQSLLTELERHNNLLERLLSGLTR